MNKKAYIIGTRTIKENLNLEVSYYSLLQSIMDYYDIKNSISDIIKKDGKFYICIEEYYGQHSAFKDIDITEKLNDSQKIVLDCVLKLYHNWLSEDINEE